MGGIRSVGSAAAPAPYQVGIAAARRYAGRLAETPPQPVANAGTMWGSPKTEAEGHQNVQAGMQGLWNWAQVFAPQGGTQGRGYKVQGVQTSGAPEPGFAPTDATMYRITPDEFLAAQYGDDWPKVRAAMEAAPQPAVVQYRAAGNTQEHLDNPYFLFMAPGEGLKSHVAAVGRNMLINPKQAEEFGVTPNYVLHHEWAHAAAPMHRGAMRDGNPQMTQDFLKHALLKDFPQLAKHPKVLASASKRMMHVSEPTEVPAYLNHMRRLHYGLTGDPLLKPEERLDFLAKVANGRPGDLGKPSMNTESMFPGAPTMKYGPNAGKPAEGYEKIQQFMRLILPNLSPGQKRDVIDTFNKGASTTDPNEAAYV